MNDSRDVEQINDPTIVGAAEWHNNSFIRTGKYILLQEPLNKEPISPDEPPSRLQEDKKLNEGYQFLRTVRGNIHLDITFVQHFEWNDIGNKKYEKLVHQTDIYLLELLGWSENDRNGLNQLSKQGHFPSSNIETINFIKKDSFNRRITEVISSSGTRVGFFDVDDAPDVLRQGIIQQASLQDRIMNHTETFNEDYIRAGLINTIASAALREWFMVGQLGYQVKKLCEEDSYLIKHPRPHGRGFEENTNFVCPASFLPC